MLLQSITFHNYRQFKGSQTISFSTDPNKNVTVIIGQNTFGKTTIVQAFIWCLYGNVDFKNKKMLNAEVRHQLESKAAGSSEYASVIIRLNHNGVNYLIERKENNTVKSLKQIEINEKFTIYECDEHGNTLPISGTSYDEIVNNILPENLSDYFFFWGERIETLSERSNLTDAVKQFLGLDTLASCIKHLEMATRKMTKEMPASGDKEISEIKEQINISERAIDKYKMEATEAEKNANYYAEKSLELFNILTTSENKELSARQDKYKEKSSQLEAKRNSLDVAKRAFNQHFNDSKNYVYYLSNTNEEKAVKLLKNHPEPTIGWKHIDVNVINEIIKRGECICGTKIENGSDLFNHLIDQKKIVAPNVTGGVINSFIEEAERRESFNANYHRLIHDDYKKIVDLKDEILELELEVESLWKVISDKTDMKTIKKKYDESLENHTSYQVKLESLQQKINDCIDDIGRYESRIQSLSSKNKKLLKYSRQLELTKSLLNLISKQYKENESELKEKLTEYVNKDFEKVYNGERRITIDDKYVSHPLALVGDKWVETSTTPGLETVKNFAYITGLVRCAKEKISGDESETVANPNTYPLVLDAPFSQADEKHVPAICDLIANVAEQIILVVMEKDWEYAKSVLDSKTGKYYSLEKVTETHSNIKEVE